MRASQSTSPAHSAAADLPENVALAKSRLAATACAKVFYAQMLAALPSGENPTLHDLLTQAGADALATGSDSLSTEFASLFERAS